jgi:hypothetical protein
VPAMSDTAVLYGTARLYGRCEKKCAAVNTQRW